MDYPKELHGVERYGFMLLTTGGDRTAVAIRPHLTEIVLRFDIVAWYDTYEEALGAVQLAAEDAEEAALVKGAIAN